MEIISLKDTYQIEREYAVGGMGVTFLVKSAKTGERLILKQLRMDKVGDWKTVELFEREAEVLRQLHHPAIPKYIDYFQSEDKKNFHLVQSFIDGKTLQQLIDLGTPFAPKEFKSYFKQSLEILTYLHGMVPPVIHRDITPKNIIIGGDKVYLVDFGSVKSAIKPEAGSFATTIGTFGYMPPEQIMGRAEAASDMYSLGMSFIAFATHKDPSELPLNSKTGQVDIGGLLKQLPSGVQQTLEAMTRMGIEERLGDAGEALDTLTGNTQVKHPEEEMVKISGEDGTVKTISRTELAKINARSKKIGAAAVSTVLVASIVFVMYLVGSKEEMKPARAIENPAAKTTVKKEVPKPAKEFSSAVAGLATKEIEQRLIESDWHGKIGENNADVTFVRQGGRLSGVIAFSDEDKLKVTVEIVTVKTDEYSGKKIEQKEVVLKGRRVADGVTLISAIYVYPFLFGQANVRDWSGLVGTHELTYKQNGQEYSSQETVDLRK